LLEGEAARLQPLNQLGQLVPGLLVRRASGLAGRLIRRPAGAGAGITRVTCSCHPTSVVRG
jgi:hypothetical protein